MKTISSILPYILIYSLIVLYISNCSEGPRIGTLIIKYRIGSGTKTCDEVGIESFNLYLYSGDVMVMDHKFDCNPDDTEVKLGDIEEGVYSVRIEGINRDGDVVYEGSADEVEVTGNIENGPYTVILEQVNPSIQIWPDFSDPGGCGRFGVENIRTVLYYEGVNKVYDETLSCDEALNNGILIEEGILEGNYDLRIRGIDVRGDYIYYYDENEIKVEAGKRKIIEAILIECPQSGCEEP